MAEAVAVATELDGWTPRNTGRALDDGTPVVVWLRFTQDGAEASDRGFAIAQVHHLTPGLRLAIRGLCRQNDVRVERGELRVDVPLGGDVNEAVDRLARTCARVAKLSA